MNTEIIDLPAYEKINDIRKIIAKYRFVADRESELTDKGYYVTERAMGSGGTGQIKILASEIRVQIGYGHGRNNYAKCVILN